MDQFGIGAAIGALVSIYSRSSRGSGRTISLVESVKDGDRICFSTWQEAERVNRLLSERGVKVECIVIDPNRPESLMHRGTSQGRTIFDHSWVEQFYANAVERAQKEIDELERQTSGYGEAHRETRRSAEEISRWRV